MIFAVPVSLLLLSSTESLDRATALVAEFKIEEALTALERAKTEGPYTHADHVRLFEQLGIALAYAGKDGPATAAFDRMLALDPAHALSYSLSPKATLVFERARILAAKRLAPAIDLALPRGRNVGDPLPVDVDILADPFKFLFQAKLHYRSGSEEWRTEVVPLDDPNGRHRTVLPAVHAVGQSSLQIYLVAEDSRGNEVLQMGSPNEPREIVLGFVPPTPWYGRWWVWTLAGAALAGATTTAIIATSQSGRPPTTPVEVIWNR